MYDALISDQYQQNSVCTTHIYFLKLHKQPSINIYPSAHTILFSLRGQDVFLSSVNNYEQCSPYEITEKTHYLYNTSIYSSVCAPHTVHHLQSCCVHVNCLINMAFFPYIEK